VTKINTVVLGKCVPTSPKTMVVDRKKLEGTSSAMLGVSTTAECWELSNIDFGVMQVT